jgi:hypothetical protein
MRLASPDPQKPGPRRTSEAAEGQEESLNSHERYEPRLLIANRHRMELIHEAEQNRLAASGAGEGPRLIEQVQVGARLRMSRLRARLSTYRAPSVVTPCVEPCPECANC